MEVCDECKCPVDGNNYMEEHWHYPTCSAVEMANDPRYRMRIKRTATFQELYEEQLRYLMDMANKYKREVYGLKEPHKDICLDEVYLCRIDARTVRREAA